jgi:hypothetical protein
MFGYMPVRGSTQVQYFVKISGIRGDDTFQGEKGWIKVEHVKVNNHGTGVSLVDDFTVLRKPAHDNFDNITLQLAQAVMKEVTKFQRVEIVAWRGLTSLYRLVLSDTSFSLRYAGEYCYTTPGASNPPMDDLGIPARSTPPTKHCGTNEYEELWLETAKLRK